MAITAQSTKKGKEVLKPQFSFNKSEYLATCLLLFLTLNVAYQLSLEEKTDCNYC